MSVREFGELTPRELWLVVDNHRALRQQAIEDSLQQAYLTAAWQRAKKMPKFATVIKNVKRQEPAQRKQTDAEMLSFAMNFQKRFEK